MRIYLVRHGQSEANGKSGASEMNRQVMAAVGLTRLGKLQAQESGKQLVAQLEATHMLPDKLRVYSAPMLRVRQTRDLFLCAKDAKGYALSTHIVAGGDMVHPNLTNREQTHFQKFKFGSFPEIRALLERNPPVLPSGFGYVRATSSDVEEAKRFMDRTESGQFYDAKPPRGEGGKEICHRIQTFVKDVLSQHDEDAVIFTHGSTIDSFVCTLTTQNEDECRALYNKMKSSPGSRLARNGEILMLEGDPKHPEKGFTWQLLPIKVPQKGDEDRIPLTAQLRSTTIRNPLHITDYGAKGR